MPSSSSPSTGGYDLEEYVPNPIAVPLLPPRRRAAATAGGHPRRRPPPPRLLAAAIAAVTIVVGVARIATDTTYLNRLCRQRFFSASVSHRDRRDDDDDVIATASNNADEAEREEEVLGALLRMPLPSTIRELDELNNVFGDDSIDPALILRWAGHRLLTVAPELPRGNESTTVARRSPLVQVTSFGPTGLVILHLLSELDLLQHGKVPVVTLDTLHLQTPSYDFYETVRSQYKAEGMELVIAKPLRIVRMYGNDDGIAVSRVVVGKREEFDSIYGEFVSELWKTDPDQYAKKMTEFGRYKLLEEFDSIYGEELRETDPDQYAELTTVGPLRQVLEERGTQMWITGQRRSSSGDVESNLRVLEFEYHDGRRGGWRNFFPFDPDYGRWKLNPLAHWTYRRVWQYIDVHDLPCNEDDHYEWLLYQTPGGWWDS
jgi:phosphoadenosine phosphosulfate reductase